MKRSWGRLRPSGERWATTFWQRTDKLPVDIEGGMLAHGRGRSYGDVALNEGGCLLFTAGLDRFMHFDAEAGLLRAEAGVCLAQILELIVPRGWFLPVTPGTREVSLGGAIANDVHGKNHHAAGSFGHHVLQFELLRSSGERLQCSRRNQPDLFAATIGGLGLTGLITWAEIQLIPIANSGMRTWTQRFDNLEAFWEINQQAEDEWPYAVAWIDCLASGTSRGRGVYFAARHATADEHVPDWRPRRLDVPMELPFSLVNPTSLRLFNSLYWARRRPQHGVSHYVPYFYPLDSISRWNRIYGRRGFFQYQCVLPPATMREGMAELLQRIAASSQGSFLAVLKTFGAQQPDGMLSFARPGASLALDFPNRGLETLQLFRALDDVVLQAGGALYPAKDARMPAAMFYASFPRWREWQSWHDPAFSSDFWKRMQA